MNKIRVGRLALFFIFLASFLAPALLSPTGGNGIQMTSGGNEFRVLAYGHWTIALGSLILLLLPITVRWTDRADIFEPPVNVLPRVGAFIIDMLTIQLIWMPVMVLGIIFAEVLYTGEWRWAFERDFQRATDMPLFLIPFFGMFGSVIGYQYWSLRTGRQTIGQYVLGFRVIADEQSASPANYGLHLFLATIAAGLWPINLILAVVDRRKRFWWSKLANTRCVQVTRKANLVRKDGIYQLENS